MHHKKPQKTPLDPTIKQKSILTILKRPIGWLSLLAAITLGTLIASWLWYSHQLRPLDSSVETDKVVRIESGSTPKFIANQLEAEEIVRSARAFELHAKLRGVENNLQAGVYRLSAALSTPEVVDKLNSGLVEAVDITFVPGATLQENRQVMIDAGFDKQEVDAALIADYEATALEGRPDGADLEGFLYPETYRFDSSVSAQAVITRALMQFDTVLEENNLIGQFDEQGLNTFEAITLASIIQRESSRDDYQKQMAQVFYLRMELGMALEADVTYQYAADKLGVPRSVDLDDPYNTRIYTGLTPGPIAVPGLSALQAVADPAEGDYLYYVSGDDGSTYFSRSLEEHNANVAEHCIEKCSIQ